MEWNKFSLKIRKNSLDNHFYNDNGQQKQNDLQDIIIQQKQHLTADHLNHQQSHYHRI